MKNNFIYLLIVLFFSMVLPSKVLASTEGPKAEHQAKKEMNVREFILDHISDSYEWHITSWGHKHYSIPLPIIVYSKVTGWHTFMSSKFHENPVYYGLTIAHEGKYKGKIVEINGFGDVSRPFDISITKVACSLIINSLLLILIIMLVVRSYNKKGIAAPTGFVGFMEMFIMNINDEVIKPCIGSDYKRYSPYLLSVFFFIFINNLMGLIPFFPGGANVTGNIAITFVLALFTFLIVNSNGTKEYWKEIFWPDVPLWLKFPIPLMPAIELVGVFTKPFALMIRLFANILAGHSIVLGLTSLVFITVKLGALMNAEMTLLSVVFSVFIDLVELLVAYIQAYVFTMLSAVFIGLARVQHHREKEE